MDTYEIESHVTPSKRKTIPPIQIDLSQEDREDAPPETQILIQNGLIQEKYTRAKELSIMFVDSIQENNHKRILSISDVVESLTIDQYLRLVGCPIRGIRKQIKTSTSRTISKLGNTLRNLLINKSVVAEQLREIVALLTSLKFLAPFSTTGNWKVEWTFPEKAAPLIEKWWQEAQAAAYALPWRENEEIALSEPFLMPTILSDRHFTMDVLDGANWIHGPKLKIHEINALVDPLLDQAITGLHFRELSEKFPGWTPFNFLEHLRKRKVILEKYQQQQAEKRRAQKEKELIPNLIGRILSHDSDGTITSVDFYETLQVSVFSVFLLLSIIGLSSPDQFIHYLDKIWNAFVDCFVGIIFSYPFSKNTFLLKTDSLPNSQNIITKL